MKVISSRRIVALLCTILLLVWGSLYFFGPPLWLASLSHKIFPPEGLYEPIVSVPFRAWDKGFSRSFKFDPELYDVYSLGFLIEEGGENLGMGIAGALRLEIYYEDQKILEKTQRGARAIGFGSKKMSQKSIDIMIFKLPYKFYSSEDLMIWVTVDEPYTMLENIGEKLKLIIRVNLI